MIRTYKALRCSATLRFFQDGLTGSAWGDWALYTDSPLRSGLRSPGYNTLPEWEKPKTGCSLRFVSELFSQSFMVFFLTFMSINFRTLQITLESGFGKQVKVS